ncbi:MAG: DUF2271 domain-containing protein [Thermofilum sp.]
MEGAIVLKKLVISSLILFLCFVSLHAQNEGKSLGTLEIAFTFNQKNTVASNQFAIWIEDEKGRFVKTIFVTQFTARGGYTFRKESLPTWVEKAKPSTLPKETIDAITGATPKSGRLVYTWDGKNEKGEYVAPGVYRFYLEATLYWSNRVIFTGTFRYGGDLQEDIPIKVEYFGDERNRDMILDVKARYVPKSQ